jgi:hypothetical protein
MASEKVAASAIRWVHGPNTPTAKAVVPLLVPARPSFIASLNLGAHVERVSEKYEISILLGGARVAALDVNPTGSHVNFATGKRESVRITHWHSWPAEDVEPDLRQMRFRDWLSAFCKRFKVTLEGRTDPPPHYGGEQLRLF